MLDIANQDAYDSDNGKINDCYADLIEMETFLLQNLFKSTKTEPKKRGEIKAKINWKKQGKKGKKEYYSKK